MTPYTKKIVELHKIHKAIEEKDCCNGEGNTPSGDITIDDVVKFIHDNWDFSSKEFPYTTWDSIPNYEDASTGDICKSNSPFSYSLIILRIDNENNSEQNYLIGVKRGLS